MVSVFLLLGCPPKSPPPGSMDISEEVAVSGVGGTAVFLPVPVPIGQGHPWTGAPQTEAQRALVDGEAILAELLAIEAATPAAIDQAMTLAEDARQALATAAEADGVRCIADARYGDVMRQLAVLFARLEPPTFSTVADREAWLEATGKTGASFSDSALTAYDSVLAGCSAGSPWHRHALDGQNALMSGG